MKLIRRKPIDARTTKHLAAIGIYVALGNVLFGIIMGES